MRKQKHQKLIKTKGKSMFLVPWRATQACFLVLVLCFGGVWLWLGHPKTYQKAKVFNGFCVLSLKKSGAST